MRNGTDGLVLSRATLRITRGGGAAERRSTAPYLVHQAVADLFGDRADRGYLYRVTGESPGEREVLILSHTPPIAPEEAGSPEHRRATAVQSKPFAPSLSPGQLLDYEIRVNATRVRRGPELDRRGKLRQHRHDVWEIVWNQDRETERTPHEVYGEWLAHQLQGVADVLDTRITERGEVEARRGDRGDVPRFVTTNLIGTLRIQDPASFMEAVAKGIGRAKAFGCGLLCISRPGTVLARRYPGDAGALL